MQLTKKDITRSIKTDPLVGSIVFGVGAASLAVSHGIQQAHNMDLKDLYNARPKTLMKPLTADVFNQLQKDPKSVLAGPMAKERKWIEAQAQRIVANKPGNKDMWQRAARHSRKLYAGGNFSAEELLPIKNEQRYLNFGRAETLRKSWYSEVVKPLADSPEKSALRAKFSNLLLDEAILNDIANPSLARKIFAPRNFKVGGMLLAAAGIGLAAYELYNVRKPKTAKLP